MPPSPIGMRTPPGSAYHCQQRIERGAAAANPCGRRVRHSEESDVRPDAADFLSSFQFLLHSPGLTHTHTHTDSVKPHTPKPCPKSKQNTDRSHIHTPVFRAMR